ncbi:hypothetical protein HK099_002697 [Clydaea vesicula]|uniref:Uncharacterized protein n=1 Tax=Clydaea vesicula TaxID=447962 RepID=A0AAD5U2G9_9FUNG|nr:hypothetical protein HK099_002697 [Clydaea vesicula]
MTISEVTAVKGKVYKKRKAVTKEFYVYDPTSRKFNTKNSKTSQNKENVAFNAQSPDCQSLQQQISNLQQQNFTISSDTSSASNFSPYASSISSVSACSSPNMTSPSLDDQASVNSALSLNSMYEEKNYFLTSKSSIFPITEYSDFSEPNNEYMLTSKSSNNSNNKLNEHYIRTQLNLIQKNNTLPQKNSEYFDFSLLVDTIIPNPNVNHSFVREFSTDEALMHFLNSDFAIEPSVSTQRGSVYKGGSMPFISQSLYFECNINGESLPEYVPKTNAKTSGEFWMNKGNDVDYFIISMNYFKNPFDFYYQLSWCCLRSRHKFLFLDEFGGSPPKAALKFLDMAFTSFNQIPIEKQDLSIKIDFYLESSWTYFVYGEQGKAIQLLHALHCYAKELDYDKEESRYPRILSHDHMLKVERRVNWVKFLCFTTFVSYPFIGINNFLPLSNIIKGDERENMDMIDEKDWENFWNVNLIEEITDDVKIIYYCKICFLVRKSIRFCNQKNDKPTSALQICNSIHLELLDWLDSLPSEFKVFNCLSNFINGVKKINLKWRLMIRCAKLAIWFLYGLIKIHHENSKLNPFFKFPLTKNGLKCGDSLDIILCSVRAISSLISMFPPKETVEKMKFADYKHFSYSPEQIVYISSILRDVSLILLDVLESNEGWTKIQEIRKEVLYFHLKDCYLTVLKSLDTHFSLTCLKKVELKVINAIGIFEINNGIY